MDEILDVSSVGIWMYGKFQKKIIYFVERVNYPHLWQPFAVSSFFNDPMGNLIWSASTKHEILMKMDVESWILLARPNMSLYTLHFPISTLAWLLSRKYPLCTTSHMHFPQSSLSLPSHARIRTHTYTQHISEDTPSEAHTQNMQNVNFTFLQINYNIMLSCYSCKL